MMPNGQRRRRLRSWPNCHRRAIAIGCNACRRVTYFTKKPLQIADQAYPKSMVEVHGYGGRDNGHDEQSGGQTPAYRRIDPQGMTLWARTDTGRRVCWRQPLVDPTRRAYGTWGGDTDLIRAADLFVYDDPDEDPLSLHSVAVALRYVAGAGGEVDPITEVLETRHPRADLR